MWPCSHLSSCSFTDRMCSFCLCRWWIYPSWSLCSTGFHHLSWYVQPTLFPSKYLAGFVFTQIQEGESRGCTGVSQRSPRLYQAPPILHQLQLILDTCNHIESFSEICPYIAHLKTQRILVRKYHAYTQFLSLISLHILSISCSSKISHFKIAARNSQLN
jgi:hypothetical protein